MSLIRSALISTLAVMAACGGDGQGDDTSASSGSIGSSGGSETSSSSVGETVDVTGPGTPTTSSGPDEPTTSSAGTTEDSGQVNPNPTISAYVGTNVSADLWAADFGRQLSGFSGTLDANGLPGAGQSGTSQTDVGFLFPTGTYELVWEGSGTVSVGGIGNLHDVTDEGDVHRGLVDLTQTPGVFGQLLSITIANGPGQSVTSLRLYPPGVEPTASFYPAFLAALTPFRALRFMDWEATNNSQLVSWSDRPTTARFGAQDGVPYELIAELINETGKDAWLTVPEKVDDDFIAQMAQFFAQELDFSRIQSARDAAGFTTPFRLYVENSNETWNGGFSAYGTFLAAANADPGRYTGETSGAYGPDWMNGNLDLMKVGQYNADRLVKIGGAFKAAFATIGKEDAVAPVLAGWALGPAFSDVGLQFITKNYGDPKTHVAAVAQAPYFGPPNDDSTGAMDSLFAAIDQDIAGKAATYAEFAQLGAEYGIPIVAYEGGQGLSGATNLPIKHLAQHDARMYAAYTSYLALWKEHFGTDLFMHFSLAGAPGIPESFFQYGYWGALEGIGLDLATCGQDLPTLNGDEPIATVAGNCPKYRALAEQVPGD
ncbi:hypothetical protein [Nannocystis punicea]|uniref:Uncharacterized protein n=1 Tax=Nannocystis punicea TaxID=2995304 RepID=A0ABY7H866_9BACT|nr:hypothetical protein [Nannocystis poenicansa]WAS95458.1 hypothetical protein O0S08_04795 [Nannocystis poenicansa]